MEQRSEEWFEARLGKATASNFSDIMSMTKSGYGASRKNYMAKLIIERLTGERQDAYKSVEMQWGIDTEPIAKLAYESETGDTITEAPFVQHAFLEAGASPDGFIGNDGVIEIKCPNSATHIETMKRKKIPPQYIAQVQGQLWITGRKWAKFVSFDPRMPVNAQLVIIDIARDEDYIKSLEQEVAKFLEEVDKETEFIKLYER